MNSFEEIYKALKENGKEAIEIKESGILTAPLLGSTLIKGLLEYKLEHKFDFSVRKYKEQMDISTIYTRAIHVVRVLKELHIDGYIRKINGLYIDEIIEEHRKFIAR